jgi:hypothetical protein
MFGEFSAANPLFPGILKDLATELQAAGPDELKKMVAEAGAWFNP